MMRSGTTIKRGSVFVHNILTALRNTRRNKTYAFISLVGLILGFTAGSLVGLYILDELSYDRWLPNHQNIYRVGTSRSRGRAGPSDLGQWLRLDHPQLDAVTRLMGSSEVVRLGDNVTNEKVTWADPNIFDVFQLDAIAGDLSSALEKPDSIVLTQTAAEKIFGDDDPIGTNLTFGKDNPMTVMAVIEDLPSNTHVKINILVPSHAPFSIAAEQDRNPVQGYFGTKLWATSTYIVLPEDIAVESIRRDMPAMLDRHLPLSEGKKNSEIYQIDIIPIADIHLGSPDPTQDAVDLKGVYTAAAIGALIILAAVINYINLMTVRGDKRAPEIGIRKTFGASRSNLFFQFMTESFLYVVVAAVISLFLVVALLPYLNSFLFRTIQFDLFTDWRIAQLYLAVVFVTGLLAGVYPSLVLSKFSPVAIFRIGASPRSGGTWVRQLLSVVQFAILTGLIVAAITIYQQARFGIDEALTQDADPIVNIFTACEEPIKSALARQNHVLGVACSNYVPQMGIGPGTSIYRKGGQISSSTRYQSVGFGFFELYGLQLVAGRLFEEARVEDVSPLDNVWNLPESIVINETLARDLEFETPQDAVGEMMQWSHLYQLPRTFTPNHDARIIGVIEDFQIGSVASDISNATFYVDQNQAATISVKVDGRNVAAALDVIDEQWKIHGNGAPIQRAFFDEMIERMYHNVMRQAQMLAVYAAVAICIAVLGIIGLAAHIAQRRTREIGIRKTLGASRTNIVGLLLWQFSIPVILSNLVAWPIAYYLLNGWLMEFERHIQLHMWIFALAGIATFAIAMFAVFSHAFLIAGVKPVVALRSLNS